MAINVLLANTETSMVSGCGRKSSSLTGWLGVTCGHPHLTSNSALVSRAQGGITLSLEEGEVDADFC